MGTLAHTQLGKLVGPADDPSGKTYMFNHVSGAIKAALDSAHPLNNDAFSGTCRYGGKIADHVAFVSIFADELAMCYAGGTATRLPLAGEKIALLNLPSCTCITDISLCKSEAGTGHLALNAADGSAAQFPTGEVSGGAAVVADFSICEGLMPAGTPIAAFPGMDLYLANVASPRSDNTSYEAQVQSFATWSALPDGGNLNPVIPAMGDTGRPSDQWILYGVLTADMPANSFASIKVELLKGGR